MNTVALIVLRWTAERLNRLLARFLSVNAFELDAPVAQMEEHLTCNQDVAGSIPVGGSLLGGGEDR